MSVFDEKKILPLRMGKYLNCPSCLEDKEMKQVFTFRCGHSLCRDCYINLKNKERCIECHEYIIDRDVTKKFDLVTKFYVGSIITDIMYISALLIIFQNFKTAVYVLFCIDFAAAVLLTVLIVKCDALVPSLKYNWIATALRINWMVYMIVTQNVAWKAVVLSMSKIFLICVTFVFEKYRDKIESYYLNELAAEDFYKFQIRTE